MFGRGNGCGNAELWGHWDVCPTRPPDTQHVDVHLQMVILTSLIRVHSRVQSNRLHAFKAPLACALAGRFQSVPWRIAVPNLWNLICRCTPKSCRGVASQEATTICRATRMFYASVTQQGADNTLVSTVVGTDQQHVTCEIQRGLVVTCSLEGDSP